MLNGVKREECLNCRRATPTSWMSRFSPYTPAPQSVCSIADYGDPQSTRPFEIGRSTRPPAPTDSTFLNGPSWPQRSGLRTRWAPISSTDPRVTRNPRPDPTSDTTPLATTRVFEGRDYRWRKRGRWIARKGPEKVKLVGRSYIDGAQKRIPAPNYLSYRTQRIEYVGALRCPPIRHFGFLQLLWIRPFSYCNTSDLRRNAPSGRAYTSV